MCTGNKTGHGPQVKECVKMFTAPMKKYCDLMIGWSDIFNICKTNTSVIYQHAGLSYQSQEKPTDSVWTGWTANRTAQRREALGAPNIQRPSLLLL